MKRPNWAPTWPTHKAKARARRRNRKKDNQTAKEN